MTLSLVFCDMSPSSGKTNTLPDGWGSFCQSQNVIFYKKKQKTKKKQEIKQTNFINKAHKSSHQMELQVSETHIKVSKHLKRITDKIRNKAR